MKTIPLTQGKFALVDDADFEYISQWKWQAHKGVNTFYATRREWYWDGRKQIYKRIQMHRVIMNALKGQEIDHENCNGMDNRQCNIRFCTKAENQRNRILTKHSSKFKGVSWHKRKKKKNWIARIKSNGRLRHLGYFCSQIEAAKTYDRAATKLFGEFALLNFPKGVPA